MKAIFCLALILVSAMAVDVRKQTMFAQTSSKLQSAIKDVKSNPFGELIMSLAEIHMATAGPLEDLKQALYDLETATSNAITSETDSFNTATDNHVSEVNKWNALIASAHSDISATESTLTNILYPRREQLEGEIANLESSIDSNIATTAAETQYRAETHANFLVQEQEYTLAIEAAHEALTLLQQLRNGEVSLAQVRVAQSSLKKVQEKVSKLKNNKYATFIKTLAQIAQNFADQEVLGKVIGLVSDLLVNCEEGLAQIRADEANAIDRWENFRLPQLQAELASLQDSLAQNQQALAETNIAIAQNELFLATRRAELASFEASLALENENYDTVVRLHEETMARLATELSGTQAGIAVINSREFSDYFHNTVNQL